MYGVTNMSYSISISILILIVAGVVVFVVVVGHLIRMMHLVVNCGDEPLQAPHYNYYTYQY